MKCKEARKFLSAFADNELDVSTNIRLLEHVEMCGDCAGRIEEHRCLKDSVASHIASVNAPDGLADRIMQSLESASRTSRKAYIFWSEFARSPWLRVVAAAASILVVFSLVYFVLETPASGLNQDAVNQHYAVLRDQLPTFRYTSDADRAKRLALFTLRHQPSVPFIDNDRFELIGAGPGEIKSRNVGHFAFRYKAVTISEFVFEGLPLDAVSGSEAETALGLARVDTKGDINLLAWRSGNFTYILVGRVPRDDLFQMVGSGI